MSEDKSFHWYLIQQILTNPYRVTDKKTSNIWGKNPQLILLPTYMYYPLQVKFVPLLGRKPAKILRKTKAIQWATKLAKGKAKGKGREQEKKLKQIKFCKKENKQSNKQDKSKFWFILMHEKQKKLLDWIQSAENYVLSVGNLFLWPFPF